MFTGQSYNYFFEPHIWKGRVIQLCTLCNLCPLSGLLLFLPQRTQRIHEVHGGKQKLWYTHNIEYINKSSCNANFEMRPRARDGSGKPTVRNERGLAADSPVATLKKMCWAHTLFGQAPKEIKKYFLSFVRLGEPSTS
jgi:hypothetical protein